MPEDEKRRDGGSGRRPGWSMEDLPHWPGHKTVGPLPCGLIRPPGGPREIFHLSMPNSVSEGEHGGTP